MDKTYLFHAIGVAIVIFGQFRCHLFHTLSPFFYSLTQEFFKFFLQWIGKGLLKTFGYSTLCRPTTYIVRFGVPRYLFFQFSRSLFFYFCLLAFADKSPIHIIALDAFFPLILFAFTFFFFLDTNFVLANYKTESCKRPPRLCRQGYACPQYHNSRDKRRSPKQFKYRYFKDN